MKLNGIEDLGLFDFNKNTEDEEDLVETDRSFTRERHFETKEEIMSKTRARKSIAAETGGRARLNMGQVDS